MIYNRLQIRDDAYLRVGSKNVHVHGVTYSLFPKDIFTCPRKYLHPVLKASSSAAGGILRFVGIFRTLYVRKNIYLERSSHTKLYKKRNLIRWEGGSATAPTLFLNRHAPTYELPRADV